MASAAEFKISSPGKVILHGEHAVVYGKAAIAAALNLRCHLTCKAKPGASVTSVSLPDVGVNQEFDVKVMQSQFQALISAGSINSPVPASEEVIQALKRFAGVAVDVSDTKSSALIVFLYLYNAICCTESGLPAVDIVMNSEIPVGAGLGSSAAFSVCLAAALLQLSGHVHSEKLDETSLGWSSTDQDIINKWAFVGEKIIHGNPSGIDNSISTFGGALRFQKGQISPIEKMPELSIMLVNTKVPRSTKVLVEGFRQKYNQYTAIFKPILDSVEAITDTAQSIYKQMCEQTDAQTQYNTIGDLVSLNHQLLNMMGVGHSSLDQIVHVAQQNGLNGKLTGAGGGGCAFIILKPGTEDGVIDKVTSDLEAQGFQVWKRTSVGSRGVTQQI